jgi:hypothetical protein
MRFHAFLPERASAVRGSGGVDKETSRGLAKTVASASARYALVNSVALYLRRSAPNTIAAPPFELKTPKWRHVVSPKHKSGST